LRGLTLDTGALIALERGRLRARQFLERSLEARLPVTVPADVVGEWWRGRTDLRDRILGCVTAEPLTVQLAKRAGEALASIGGATLVDAIVMASAASRGDVVLSSDVGDLERLRAYFVGVKVLGV
jgi:predicted nucleic acid-binding protein